MCLCVLVPACVHVACCPLLLPHRPKHPNTHTHTRTPTHPQHRAGPPHAESKLNALLPFIPATTAVLRTGGYGRESAEEAVHAGRAALIGFGKPFISNPDLPERLRAGKALRPHENPASWYGGSAEGYTTYTTWAEQEADAWLASTSTKL